MPLSSNPADVLLQPARRLASRLLPNRYKLQLAPLINSLLPSLLRQPVQLAWLNALLSPLLSVYEQFAEHVAAATTELSYTGQTAQLERALNDRFDPEFRRIRIINSDTELEPVYFNFLSEAQPLQTIYHKAEGEPLLQLSQWAEYVNQVGFTVRVPRALRPQQAALNTRIKQLKLSLIRHTIVYF